jgi:hypothetical protein
VADEAPLPPVPEGGGVVSELNTFAVVGELLSPGEIETIHPEDAGGLAVRRISLRLEERGETIDLSLFGHVAASFDSTAGLVAAQGYIRGRQGNVWLQVSRIRTWRMQPANA